MEVILSVERPLGYYLFEIYTPAVFIVFMSWFNFWLNRFIIDLIDENYT